MIPSHIVVGDVSFRGAGIVSLRRGRIFTFAEFKTTEKKVTSFPAMLRASDEIACQYEALLDIGEWENGPDFRYVFELPPPRGIFSPGLTYLNGLITSIMIDAGYESCGCSCMLVKSVLGGRKKTKADSVKLVKQVLETFSDDYIFKVWDGNTAQSCDNWREFLLSSHNICEAFIILMAYAYTNDWGEVFPAYKELCGKKYKFVEMEDEEV